MEDKPIFKDAENKRLEDFFKALFILVSPSMLPAVAFTVIFQTLSVRTKHITQDPGCILTDCSIYDHLYKVSTGSVLVSRSSMQDI